MQGVEITPSPNIPSQEYGVPEADPVTISQEYGVPEADPIQFSSRSTKEPLELTLQTDPETSTASAATSSVSDSSSSAVYTVPARPTTSTTTASDPGSRARGTPIRRQRIRYGSRVRRDSTGWPEHPGLDDPFTETTHLTSSSPFEEPTIADTYFPPQVCRCSLLISCIP